MLLRCAWLGALFGLALAGWGCPGNPTQQPCDLDCGDHGSCIIASGRTTCLCVVGWTGPACDSCAEGYSDFSGECLPIGPDPCDPNPCSAPHQSVCQVMEGEAVCRCDPDAQDNDGDGSCRPSCQALAADFPTQTCDDASGLALLLGQRSCETLLRYTPVSDPPTDLYARGDFNAWELSDPMLPDQQGVYSVRLNLPAGDYAYKFFDSGPQSWFEDPANPFHRWLDGERNSRLRVPDCTRPVLVLLHRPQVEGDRLEFAVQYLDGSQAAGLDVDGIQASLSGIPVQGSFDANLSVLSIQAEGLVPGKLAYRFEANDTAGRAANPLVVPIWVEAQPFDWRDAVLYFAMTDRFVNGQPANDAAVAGVDPKANWQGGDFAGLRQTIEAGYFDDLGVNAIWISSIVQNTAGGFPGDDGRLYTAYHSYWPISSGWTEESPLVGVAPVDPHFGDLEEFKRLVTAAHARGIRVLVDLVLNHVHVDAPLWQNHQADWPAWFHLPSEGCQETNWTKPISCWFANYLPDFEYKNPATMDAIMEHAAWLVRETNIDGFRVDAVKHMIDDAVLHLRGRLEQEFARTGIRFYMVGETFTGEDGADLLAHYLGPDMLDGQFDFPLYWQLTAVFLREERDLSSLSSMVEWNDTRYGDFAVMSNFLGNHDVCRALSQANGDITDIWCNGGKAQGWDDPPGQPGDETAYLKLRLAWTFLLTSPGVPLIYYGDEFGLAGAGDPDNRRPMLLGPENLDPNQLACLNQVQTLGQARARHPAMRRGQRMSLLNSADGQSWAYGLTWGTDRVVVVLNRAADPRQLQVPVEVLGLDEGAQLVDVLSNGAPVVTNGSLTVDLDGRSAAVLVME